MKNNKVLMSLVVASISAMAAAPFVLDLEDNKESGKVASDDSSNELSNNLSKSSTTDKPNSPQLTTNTISIETILAATMMSGQDAQLEKDLTDQTAAMLNKKDTLQPLYESISIVAENYGSSHGKVMRKEIYDEFNFGYQDSTSSGGTGASTYVAPAHACHYACHSACHSACHGSRGWR